jgi:hypothetical protein
VTQQQSGTRSREYVRKLPHLTQEQIIAAPRQQARHDADPSYSGHHAGIHPEHQPYESTELSPMTFHAEDEYELEEDDAYYHTRLPTSARRYQGYAISPEEVYQSGNTRYHVRYVDVPKRKSRQQLPPPQQQPERYAEAAAAVTNQHNRNINPLVWFGLFLTLLIVGWIGLNAFTAWYQGVKDDVTYGQHRHFEIDAVVGHNDSPAHPSHFTAENDNGQILVIELPGGEVSKARIYQIETVPGNTGNPLVRLTFADMNADGKLDMLVQIGDTNAVIYVTLFNNGSQFVSKL